MFKFQSTPPHGGRRPGPHIPIRKWARFNPRPRTGGDDSYGEALAAVLEFQSTPPHGGRLRASQMPCFSHLTPCKSRIS